MHFRLSGEILISYGEFLFFSSGLFSGDRLWRGRHHGRRRGPGNSTATSGIRELEAELQEELFRLPAMDERSVR